MKKQFIKDFKDGDRVSDVFLLAESESRETRENKPYLTMLLADRTGTTRAIFWNYDEKQHGEIKKNDYVQVKGTVGLYREELQIKVFELDYYPDENANPEDFLRATEKDRDKLLDKLLTFIDEVKNKHIKKLCKLFFDDKEFVDKFCHTPAAKQKHHPYIGGLLEHTHNMVRICKALSFVYPQVDVDLLVAGAIFHDVAKIKEYTYDRAIDFTMEGRLKGHLVMGVEMVNERIAQIPDFPPELKLKIEHMILAHHGNREWGSPVEPQFAEANMMHFADNLDARTKMFEEAGRQKVEEGEWSVYSKPLERHVYVGEQGNSEDNH